MAIFLTPQLDADALKVLGKIEDMKKRLGSMLSEPRRWEGLLRRVAFAKAIRGSNTIEGYNITVDDAIAAVEGEPPLEADEQTWLEIKGYQSAMTYVLQLAKDQHFAYSGDLLRSLHYMMLQHDLSKGPGTWRPGQIYVRDDARGETVYEGPDAGLVQTLMGELTVGLNATEEAHPIVRAAMAHLNLTMIHPFRDGNGRMARCLQTLVLARSGQHLNPVFSSIEEYLGRNQQDYYRVLATVGMGQWHPERDALPWIRFCLTAHFRQATTVLNRIERLHRVWDAIEAELVKRGLPDRTIYALADAAMGHNVRNPTYRKAADITANLASRDLKLLVDQNLLEPKGDTKARYYVAAPIIREIRRANETAKKEIPDPFHQLSLGI